MPRVIPLVEVLQLPLERVDRLRVEQVAQFRLAEQFAELRVIDRERLRAALGERRVAVVQEVGDVAEEQRGGEGRRLARVHRHDVHRARLTCRSVSTSAGMSNTSRRHSR